MTSENVVINGATVMHTRKHYGDAFEKHLTEFRNRTHEDGLLARYVDCQQEWLTAIEWASILVVGALALTLFETALVLVEGASVGMAVGWTSAFWMAVYVFDFVGEHRRRLEDFVRRARIMANDLDALVVYRLPSRRKDDGEEAQS